MPSKSAAEVMAALKDCGAENDGHLQRLEKKDCIKKTNETPLLKVLRTILFLSWAPVDLKTLSSLRADPTLKTVVKCKFFTCSPYPFITSCVSDAHNCGRTQICLLRV